MPNNTLQHTEAPTYRVVTYGCQMNVHDSERIAGLLEEAGYVPDPRTDTLAPTGLVMATLQMLDIKYSHWLKFVWPLVVFVLVYGGILLVLQTVV